MDSWMRETNRYLEELVEDLNTNFAEIVKNNNARKREIRDLRKSLVWLAVDVAILGVISVQNRIRIDKIEEEFKGKNDGI